MKRIVKREEPADFRTWKAKAQSNPGRSWKTFRRNSKMSELVRKSLLEEQGNLCCYCGRRVEARDSHFEHIRPQSRFPQEVLQYENLLASCQRDLQPEEPRHCGMLKGDWFEEHLLVSPLSEDCEQRFRYTRHGEIYPQSDEDKAAKETIARLGLDIPRLQALRQEAIDAAVGDWEHLTADDARRLVDGFIQRDSEGKFHPFCLPITFALTTLYLTP